MKIAVSSRNAKTISGPASHCPHFLLYETNGLEIVNKTRIQLTSEQIIQNQKDSISTTEDHPLYGIECLITENLGTGVNQSLKEAGIKTVATNATEADGAVSSYLKAVIPPSNGRSRS